MEPDVKAHDCYMEFFEIYRNLYNHLKGDYEKLYWVTKKYEK